MLIKKGTANLDYLDITTLEVGKTYNKICYLENLNQGRTKVDTGFYTFYFKDRNANMIVGRLFNIEDFIQSGIIALNLRRKSVKIDFLVQEYNGSLSLIINSIELFKGIGFEYSKFIGEVENVEESITTVNQLFAQKLSYATPLPILYKTESLMNIYNGKCGGYCKLLEMVCYDLLGIASSPSIDLDLIVDVFYKVQDFYFTHLKGQVFKEYVSVYDSVMEISDIVLKLARDKNKVYVIDALIELFDINKSETLYGTIIAQSFKNNIEVINLTNTYDTMIDNSFKKVGERVLKRV